MSKFIDWVTNVVAKCKTFYEEKVKPFFTQTTIGNFLLMVIRMFLILLGVGGIIIFFASLIINKASFVCFLAAIVVTAFAIPKIVELFKKF